MEILVGAEETYERSQREALALLEHGFHLGGVIRANRDELHERRRARPARLGFYPKT